MRDKDIAEAGMNDHLPECEWGAGYFKRIAEHLFGPDYPCPQCDALRRCERRVRLAVSQEGAMESGWKAGLHAAREAVESVRHWDGFDGVAGTYRATDKDMILAAIDALRGEE